MGASCPEVCKLSWCDWGQCHNYSYYVKLALMCRLHHSGSSWPQARSMSPTISSAKPTSEESSEKENQSYTTASLQLLDLMDTLFSRYDYTYMF